MHVAYKNARRNTDSLRKRSIRQYLNKNRSDCPDAYSTTMQYHFANNEWCVTIYIIQLAGICEIYFI